MVEARRVTDEWTSAHEALLGRLRKIGVTIEARATGPATVGECQARLVGCASRSRERFTSVNFESPWIVLVLEGQKWIDAGLTGAKQVVRAGEALLPPIGVPMAVTNVPDAKSGQYRVLLIEVLGDAQALVRRHHADFAGPLGSWFGDRARVVVPGLPGLQAFEHFCETVMAPTAHPCVLLHRLEGLLLALLVQEQTSRAGVARVQAHTDVVLAVRNLVRESPEAEWSADLVAGRLSVSPATLRRKLAREGTNLRTLILHERMYVAKLLLSDGRLGVGEVALRCGYESATKFSRQFARSFGQAPSALKGRGAA